MFHHVVTFWEGKGGEGGALFRECLHFCYHVFIAWGLVRGMTRGVYHLFIVLSFPLLTTINNDKHVKILQPKCSLALLASFPPPSKTTKTKILQHKGSPSPLLSPKPKTIEIKQCSKNQNTPAEVSPLKTLQPP